MKKPLLQSSNNATLFVKNDEQRPINPLHVKRLATSMSKHGFLPSKPIQVYRRKDGKMIVVDGHHRLEAAKMLGVIFYYVVEEEVAQQSMPDVQKSLSWKSEDYIRQYSLRGLKDYSVLASYIARGLPTMFAASILYGHSGAAGGMISGLIAGGTYKVKTVDHAEKILSLIESENPPRVFKHANFIKALALCLWLKQFDFGTFKKRAEGNWHMIPNCSNVPDFLTAIEEVYNFRSQVKQPIAHLARVAAKDRSAIKTA